MLQLTMSRDDAWALLTDYTKGESLLKHAIAVEAAVRLALGARLNTRLTSDAPVRIDEEVEIIGFRHRH